MGNTEWLFILATKVTLGMGITDGRLLYCRGVAEEMWTREFQDWSIAIGRFMNTSIITLQLVLIAQI